MFFGSVRQNVFDRISRYPLPLLSMEGLDIRTLLEAEKVPIECFRYCKTKKSSTESLDTPPNTYPKAVSVPEFLGNTEGLRNDV